MKKLLVTGGVLFSILPAMATDLSLSDWHLIDSNTENPTCSGPEGYTGFVNGDVTMAPLSIQQCDPGYYLNATSETQIQEHQDSNEDLDYYYIQACTQCPVGHSCAGVSNPTVVNDSLGVMGLGAECSAGTYATAGQSSCTACAPGTYTAQTGQSSCTNAQAGYYTPNTTSEELCPTGYQDGVAGSGTTIDACSKTVDSTYCNNLDPCSNFNNIVTSGNNACTTSVNSNNANIVNGSITFGAKNAEPLCLATFECAPGYAQTNPYQWIIDNSERIVSYSNCSIDGQYGTSCSTMERGTLEWHTAANDTKAPFSTMHLVAKCSGLAPTSAYHVADDATGFNTNGRFCWLKVVDFPNQEWFIGGAPNQDQAECEATCGVTMASATYPFGDIDSQTNQYVANQNSFFSLSVMANLTASASVAEHSMVKICAARTVSINWAGVAEPGAAATCTYGEGLTVPTPDTNPEGYNFVGWTVGEVTNNNNQNNSSNEEPGNEEPGNNEPE